MSLLLLFALSTRLPRDNFFGVPEVCKAVIYVIFKDVCTEEVISGKIVCNKCKLDPSSVELALTATGKHPFTFKIQKDFCGSEDELFAIIVDGDEDEE